MADARTDEVACSYCLEYGRFLISPRSLPCGHFYCQPCLETDYEKNRKVRCPKCRIVYDVEIQSLPHADLTGSTTPVWCDVCLKKGERKPAKGYCAVCTTCYCTKHQESHDDVHDDHNMMPILDYRHKIEKLQTRNCRKHSSQTYSLGCKACLNIFCVQCMTDTTPCTDGSAHKMLMLDELVTHIERSMKELRSEAFRLDTILSALSKKCTIKIDEHESETEKLLQLLHQTRDEQLESIRAKYDKLEAELIEKRKASHQEIEEFHENKIGAVLSDLRRELELTEARLRDNHQVDVILSYKETECLIRSLIDERTPSLKVDNIVSLQNRGSYREIEVTITDSVSVTVTADKAPLSAKPKSSVGPANSRLDREVVEGSEHNYQNHTYGYLDNGAGQPLLAERPFVTNNTQASSREPEAPPIDSAQEQVDYPQETAPHLAMLLPTETITDLPAVVDIESLLVAESPFVTNNTQALPREPKAPPMGSTQEQMSKPGGHRGTTGNSPGKGNSDSVRRGRDGPRQPQRDNNPVVHNTTSRHSHKGKSTEGVWGGSQTLTTKEDYQGYSGSQEQWRGDDYGSRYSYESRSRKEKKDWRQEKERFLCMTRDERRMRSKQNYVEFSEIRGAEAMNQGRHRSVATKMSIWAGDITKLEIDAIVNVANSTLLGGGEVDGAIHKAAGPFLKAECEEFPGRFGNRCQTGDSKITGGFNLPSKYVIHTVGPRGQKPDKLASCYQTVLDLVLEYDLMHVAIPCISTDLSLLGIYGYPNKAASQVAFTTVVRWIENHPDWNGMVIFCVFLREDKELYEELLNSYRRDGSLPVPTEVEQVVEQVLVVDDFLDKRSTEKEGSSRFAGFKSFFG